MASSFPRPSSRRSQIGCRWGPGFEAIAWHNFGFHGNHGFHGSMEVRSCRFLTGNHSKTKILVPLVESHKSNFLKDLKNQIEWHHSWNLGDSNVNFKVVEARKRVWSENCHQGAIKSNIKSKCPPLTPFRILSLETSKERHVRGGGVFCMKTAETCCSKTCVNF